MKVSFICLKSQEKTCRLRSADYGLRVKRARNLLTGEVKILKWVFKERFNTRIGGLVFECVRSHRKEARILELVRGRPEFKPDPPVAAISKSFVGIIMSSGLPCCEYAQS